MAITDTFTKQVKHKGSKTGEKYSDGGGMYLHVTSAGKYWRMAYRFAGKQKTLALGIYPDVSLANARKGRATARERLAQGIDPSTAKREEKQSAVTAASTTYEAVAREFHKTQLPGWSDGHASKWLRMNELYLFPHIGGMPIADIKARHVLQALRKVEAKGILSTAHDVQQMAGQVFRHAVQSSYVESNPIPDLKGALQPHIAEHFSAVLEPVKVGELLRAMDGYRGQPATRAALQLSALLFQRPGNIRAMEWGWIDLEDAMMAIPAAEMKARKEQKKKARPHSVPLARQAVAILEEIKLLTGHGRYVFPGARSHDRPMSDGTVNAALRRLDFGNDEHVAHGFRAMARTMMAERLQGIPADMVEAQLAHGKSGPLGSAYDRAEFKTQRRQIMQTWADYLDKLRQGADVIQMPTKAA
jgi:integrase